MKSCPEKKKKEKLNNKKIKDLKKKVFRLKGGKTKYK